MFKKGITGGLISISNILNPDKIDINNSYRFASKNIREAFRLGLQSLYEDPDQVLEKYKDFDIVKAMKERKGSKLLWVRARAIDADVVNTNGDYFSKEELLGEIDFKGEKIPAYKSFEGVPIFSNHKNDDVDLARGVVVYAEWNEDENAVYCTFFIDEDAYPDIARAVRQGVITDVSMGASVTEGECSVCGNKAVTESLWCMHQKKFKGRKDPDSGKLVYEINRGIKFIELSLVGDGAFDTCEIKALIEPDEMFAHIDKLDEKIASIQQNLTLAATQLPSETINRIAYENCLRQINSTSNTIVKIAQQASNLVGGQLLSIDNANQNATVNNILQYLGISGHNGLNVLDLMNLALNFLEVAVMNLFSRKDNIDLNHVGKITKAMAELQSTMQDLIDDGMGNSPGNAPSTPNPQVPTESNVGQVIAPGQTQSQNPTQTQTQSFSENSMDDNNPFSSENDILKGAKADNMLVKLGYLLELLNFDTNNLEIKDNLSCNDNNINDGGNNLMSFAKKFAHKYNEEKNIYEVESDNFKIVLSSDGKASGYIDNRKTSFDPIVTPDEAKLIEKGDLDIAGERILNRLMKIAATIYETPSIAQLVNEDNAKPDKVTNKPIETQLVEDHLYNKNDNAALRTLQERTESRRHETKGPIESRLGEEGWNTRKGYQTKTYEEMLDKIVLPRGEYDDVIENLLQEKRIFKNKSAVSNVEKVIMALATAAINTGMTPDEIMDGAKNVANAGPDLITKSQLAKEDGNDVPGSSDDPTMATADALSDQVDDTTTSGDLHQGLVNALNEFSVATKALTNAVNALAQDNVVAPKIDESTPSDSDLVGADLASKADDSDPNVSETDVKSGVSSIANTADDLGIGTDDVLNATKGADEDELQKQIELSKTSSASAIRAKNMKRIAFYGFNRKASRKDILRTLVGHLADYSKDYNLRSKDLARVICSFNDAPNISRKLAAQALNEKRTASINVREEKHNVKEFCLSANDLGVDVNDPNIDEVLKTKIASVLQSKGMDLGKDFSLTSVDYLPDGKIMAKVESRVSKMYTADSAPDTSVADQNPDLSDMSQMVTVQPSDTNNPRAAKRAKLMEKFAQLSPGIVPGGAPTAPPAPAGLTPGAPGTAGAGPAGPESDPSLSPAEAPSPTSPPAGLGDDPSMGGEDSPNKDDGSFSPGVKKPWGTVCPQCQSVDLDTAGGQGKCNSCGAQLTFEMSVKVAPPDKGEKYKGNLDPKGFDSGSDSMGSADAPSGISDAGLGDSTAPGLPPLPSAPGGGLPQQGTESGSPVTATADHAMFRISYTTDPDVFIGNSNIKTAGVKIYPAGMVCPVCTSRDVNKSGQQSQCNACNTMFVTNIQNNPYDSRLLDTQITWII